MSCLKQPGVFFLFLQSTKAGVSVSSAAQDVPRCIKIEILAAADDPTMFAHLFSILTSEQQLVSWGELHLVSSEMSLVISTSSLIDISPQFKKIFGTRENL